jgi:Tol biopolymer transport system component
LSIPFDANGRSLNSPYDESSAQISGRYITFVSDRRGSPDVYLFDFNDRRLIPLPNLNRFDTITSDPAVSENGQYIAFAGSREGRLGIYLYNRTTQQVRLVTRNLNAEVRNPSLSADGGRIAFEVNSEGRWDIAIYDRQGRPLNIPTNPR